jgi:magnesium transporter
MTIPSYCPVCFGSIQTQARVCPGCQTDIGRWEQDHPYIERLIQALKHPSSDVRIQTIIRLGRQGDVQAAIPLAECALAHPLDVVQGREIIRSVRQLPVGRETAMAFSMLASHPARSIREAVIGNGIHLRCFQLTANSALEPLPADVPSAAWLQDDIKRWLDIELQELQALQWLLAPFDLPPQILHYCMEGNSVTRVEAHDHLVFVIMPLLAASSHLQWASLSVVCLPTLLVTMHTHPFPSLVTLTAKLTTDTHMYAPTIPALLCHVLHQFIEEDFRYYLDLREAVIRLTDVIDDTSEFIEGKTILDLKRKVSHLANTCENQLFATMALSTIESPVFSVRNLRKYYAMVAKGVRHCQRGISRLESHVQDLHQHYVLRLQQTTNHRLRILTIMSAVFMPLTLLTGIYGMNFAHMPELAHPAAYPIVLGAMLAIAILLLAFFYLKGWFACVPNTPKTPGRCAPWRLQWSTWPEPRRAL